LKIDPNTRKGKINTIDVDRANDYDYSAILKVSFTYIDSFSMEAMSRSAVVPGSGVIGTISELSPRNEFQVEVGDTVYIEPSIPCNRCIPCLTGHYSACVHKKSYGISTVEHAQVGGCAEYINILRGSRVHRLTKDYDKKTAALYVQMQRAIAAVGSKGKCGLGKHVLIAGNDLFGALCAVAAVDMGASAVVLRCTNAIDKALMEILLKKGIKVVNEIPSDHYSLLLIACAKDPSIQNAFSYVEPLGRCVITKDGTAGQLPIQLIRDREIEITGLNEAAWTFEQAQRMLFENQELVAAVTVKEFSLERYNEAAAAMEQEPYAQFIISPNN